MFQVENGEVMILMRARTSHNAFAPLQAANGVLTAYIGLISHTVLIARGQVPIIKLTSAKGRP